MDKRRCAKRRSLWAGCWHVLTVCAALLLGSIRVMAAGSGGVEPAPNPHGDATLCHHCHTSARGGRNQLLFGGNTSHLCRSCHDGKRATGEAHPVGMAPSTAKIAGIPAQFPLEEGKLTCLTCHEVTWHCKSGRPSAIPSRSFLRGAGVSHPMDFCFQCHKQQDYQPFNAHDQVEGDNIRTETCAWCHIRVPDVGARLKEGASYALRSESFGVCNNCHLVDKNHPTGDRHMYATPSPKMLWHMSAYELQPQMRLSYRQLLEYVRAAKRTPQSIPLDEKGRITCYSCHNPHEKGLLPDWNLRSVGAQPEQAASSRLRAHGGIACRACHEK